MSRQPRTEAGRALLRSDFDTTGWGPRMVREHVTAAVFAIEDEAGELDRERLARALDPIVAHGAEVDELAAAIADAYEADPGPLWDDEGPKVGQVITIAGSNVQARWTGTFWERLT